jgi:hypothetical protein
MAMRMDLMAVAAILLVPGVAHAQDWRLASKGDTTESVFFLDADSISAPQAKAQGRIFVFVSNDDKLSAIEAVLEFECATGRRRVVNLAVYDTGHNLITRNDRNDGWEETPKLTQFDRLREIICGERPIATESYGAELPFAAGQAIVAKP